MTRVLSLALASSLFVACAGEETSSLTDNPGGDTGTLPDPEPTPFEAFDDADLTDAASVQGLTAASSPNIFALMYLAGVSASSATDPKCPSVVEDKAAGVATYTGGCTSTGGVTYTGSVTITIDPKVKGTNGILEFDGFGIDNERDCSGGGTVVESNSYDGLFVLEPDGSFMVDASARVAESDFDLCTSVQRDVQIDYEGSAVGIGGKGTQTWSGSGTYAHSEHGKVEVQTFSEILEGACGSEADSGTTVMMSGGDQVTITYDGAVDCDPNGTVTWMLNGELQGELGGVACSNAGAGTAGGMLALAGMLLLRRRRED